MQPEDLGDGIWWRPLNGFEWSRERGPLWTGVGPWLVPRDGPIEAFPVLEATRVLDDFKRVGAAYRDELHPSPRPDSDSPLLKEVSDLASRYGPLVALPLGASSAESRSDWAATLAALDDLWETWAVCEVLHSNPTDQRAVRWISDRLRPESESLELTDDGRLVDHLGREISGEWALAGRPAVQRPLEDQQDLWPGARRPGSELRFRYGTHSVSLAWPEQGLMKVQGWLAAATSGVLRAVTQELSGGMSTAVVGGLRPQIRLVPKNLRTALFYLFARQVLQAHRPRQRPCARCGRPMDGRSDKKFCSANCKQLTYYHGRPPEERRRGRRQA